MNRPRLLFDEAGLAAVRARLRGPRGARMLAHAVGYCERYLDRTDPFYFDFRELRSAYWRAREGNFVVPGHLAALALTGWIAQRREFLETARDALMTVIAKGLADQTDAAHQAAPGRPVYPGWRRNAQHDAGKFFFTVGFLYDTLQDVLSPEQRRAVLAYAVECLRIGLANLTRELPQTADNNRSGRFAAGLCVLAAAIEGEPGVDPVAKTLVDAGPKRLERILRWSFGAEGEPYEGASYGPGAMMFYLLCAEIFARSGRRDLRGDARFDAMSDYLAHELVVADGYFNNLNDCQPEQLAQTLLWSGCVRRRPAALWTWDRTGGNEAHPNGMTRPEAHARDFGLAPWALLWVDDAAQARAPEEGRWPLDRRFRERGVVVMRTGWAPESLHATLFSGRQAHSAHCQHDLNQVTFYALGERFIVDVGYWTTDPATGAELPGWPAEAHNLVSVDGLFQRGRHTNDWAEGRIAAFARGEEFAYALGDAREALGEVRRNERHVLLSRRPDAPPYLLWLDDVELDDSGAERDFTLYLHTAPGNRIRIGPSGATIEGAQASLDLHLATARPARLSVGAYGHFPRLEIALRAARGRFPLLLHPRRSGDPAARFRAVERPEAVDVEVEISVARHAYRFDTAPRPEATAGEDDIRVARLA
jgi:hypothetical protein